MSADQPFTEGAEARKQGFIGGEGETGKIGFQEFGVPFAIFPRVLTEKEIMRYQQIVVALKDTINLMMRIDQEVEFPLP